MKNGRGYIPSLVIFMHYLHGLSSGGKQKYLALFAAFYEHKKNAICKCFCLILWINGMKELAYLLSESVQTSVLLVCCLLMACKSS